MLKIINNPKETNITFIISQSLFKISSIFILIYEKNIKKPNPSNFFF